MRFDAADIARATGGALRRAGPAGPITTDTRTLQPGDWFVALQGPRFDGHDYLATAAAAGAVGAVVSRADVDFPGGLVVVVDTTVAYGALGLAVRRSLTCPVVALTGTSGKTTTRALIALALEPLGPIHQTQANLNNQLGVPLTLLACPPDPAAVVLEMGTSGPGEIARLARLGEPTHRLVVNVGHGHLDLLGDIDGVGVEKRAMLDTARAGDTAFINLDDPRLRDAALPAGVRRITFGRDPAADARLVDVTVHPDTLSTRAEIVVGGQRVTAELPAFGVHFAHNATAALAIAWSLGVDPAEAARCLARYAPVGLRQRIERLPGGAIVLNDCYNANPESMRAALDTLAALPGPRVAVLGDMLELGAHEAELHAEILDHTATIGLEELVVVGPRMGRAAVGRVGVRVCADGDDALVWARERLARPATALVKGSRGMRLERIVQGLLPGTETA